MSNEETNVKLGADTSELESGLHKAGGTVKDVFADMDKSFASTMAMGTALGEIIGEFLGEAIKDLGNQIRETVSATLEFREEADNLGRKLGTTATEAANVAAALGNVYVSTDEYASAAKGMEKMLKTNEKGLQDMGLATRNAKGELRPLSDLMLDGIGIVNEYKNGTDKNIAATQIFGKAIEDGSRLLDYNKEVLAGGIAENERYGLVVGVEAVDDLEQFKAAHDDVGDSLMGMRNAIGNALIPVLTELSKWFAEIAPAAIVVLKGVIGGLVSIFWGLKLAAEIVWNSIAMAIEIVTVKVMMFGEIVWKALHGDWAGIQSAWDRGTSQIADITAKRMGNIVNDATDTQEKLRRLFDDQTAITPEDESGKKGAHVKQPKAPKEKAEHEQSQIPAMRAELDGMIEEKVGYYASSLALEIQYWNDALGVDTLSSKDAAKIHHTLYELKKKQAKEAFTAEIEDLKRQSDMEAGHGEERIAIARQIAKRMGEAYGLNSPEYIKAQQAVIDETVAQAKRLIDAANAVSEAEKNAALISLDAERENLSQKKAMGLISNVQEIDGLIKFEQQKFAIENKAAVEELARIDKRTVAWQTANDKILADEKKHDVELQKLRNKRELEEHKSILTIANGIEGAMKNSFVGVLNGTMTLADGMRNLFKGIFDSIIGELANFAAQWIMQHAMMALFGKQSAMGEISNAAALAGANGIASFAKAPWPIDLGAPMFGASMAGAAMAYGGLLSAEGGFDIPAGVNPLVQTHQKEMILPAKQAEVIRGMANGKSGAGGNTYNISAIDAAGVKKFLMRNGNLLADSLSNQARNFKVKT